MGTYFRSYDKRLGGAIETPKQTDLTIGISYFFVINFTENSNILITFPKVRLIGVLIHFGCVIENITTLHSSEPQEADLSIYDI